MAKLKGASRVIGSAGSDDKVKLLLEEYGFDAAFNYKKGPVAEQLREAAPDGIDVYFDNVGGEHLEAALSSLNVHGRATICGMIAQYNDTEPVPGPRNLALVIGKRLRLQGVLVGDHTALQPQFVREVMRLAGLGRAEVQRDLRGGHRERLRRLPRSDARREHRKDDRLPRLKAAHRHPLVSSQAVAIVGASRGATAEEPSA